MIHNLKTVWLALVAIFAIGALVASTASADDQGTLTSDGPVLLTGTETSLFIITYSANQQYECHGHYAIGNVNKTPHGLVSTPEKTFTITPQFSNCVGHVGEVENPATFTMNGCDFVLHITDTESAGVYRTTLDMVCPAGKEIEFHMYSNGTHATTTCTYKFPAQTGITGATASNSGEGITLNGTFTGIHEARTGILCGGTNTNNNASMDIDVLITGKNEAAESTKISLTD